MRPANSASLAVVCFSRSPALDLARLAEEVGAGLGLPRAACSVTRSRRDAIALFDLEGTRVGLGFREIAPEEASEAQDAGGPKGAAPGAGSLDLAAVLVVSVGGDGITVPLDDCPLHADRYALCAGVIDRVGAAGDIAMMVWLEERRAFGADLFDTIVTAVTNPALAGSAPARAAARVAAPPPPRPDGAAQPEAAVPPAGRFAPPPPRDRDPEAVAMRNIRSALYDADPATLAPSEPRWRSALTRLSPARAPRAVDGAARPAGEPPADAAAAKASRLPLPHRLTIYTMGATLMVISLPIGAALMTYFALGRENLRLAARAVAITGTAVGLGQLPEVQRLLSLVG